MAELPNSERGIEVADKYRSMAYLYGLSDFWSTIFEEPEVFNSVLEANTVQLSEVYSEFLQLTSSISLTDIQDTINNQVKLFIIREDSLVEGAEGYTYKLNEKVISSDFIYNRPFLPTSSLEEEVHYTIDENTQTIRFAKSIGSFSFAARKNSDGVIEYAVWFANLKTDEDLIYKHYGRHLRISPDTLTDSYKKYVQGLYFLYFKGPTLTDLKKGLNIVLGVPIARKTEIVKYITTHVETNDYLVVTDTNTYLIPYGLKPDLEVGNVIQAGQELASWIQVTDYVETDNWWVNLSIPPEVIPMPPNGVSVATPGSDLDTLMRDYLKHHTFLVNLKTEGLNNINIFNNIATVVGDVKPSYTFPVYIWSVPIEVEEVSLQDNVLNIKALLKPKDVNANRDQFLRDNQIYTRNCAPFIRSSITERANAWVDDRYDVPMTLEGEGQTVLDPNVFSGDIQWTRSSRDISLSFADNGLGDLEVTIANPSNNEYIYTTFETTQADLEINYAVLNTSVDSEITVYISPTLNTGDAVHSHVLAAGIREEVITTLNTPVDFYYFIVKVSNGSTTEPVETIVVSEVSIKETGSTEVHNRSGIGVQAVYESGTHTESLFNAMHTRGGHSSNISRGHVFYKDRSSELGHGVGTYWTIPSSGILGTPFAEALDVNGEINYHDGQRVFLYSITESELNTKLTALGLPTVDSADQLAIFSNDLKVTDYQSLMFRDYSRLTIPSISADPAVDEKHIDDYDKTFLDFNLSMESYRVSIVKPEDIDVGDFVIAVRIFDKIYSMYLLKKISDTTMKQYKDMRSGDKLSITATSDNVNRSTLTYDSGLFLTRGTQAGFTDADNVSPVTMTRDGTAVNLVSRKKVL